MIKNDRQLKITCDKVKEFKQALEELERQFTLKPEDILLEIQRNAVKSEYETLGKQIEHYNGLKDGSVKAIICSDWDGIGKALIEMRIALNLTQEELAERVQIHEQQIQRYEATDYDAIGKTKMAEIADALGMSELNLEWQHPNKIIDNLLLPKGITKELKEQVIQEVKQFGIWRAKRIYKVKEA